MKKTSPRIPMYTQIREYILDQIRNQAWKPNDRLPSENELAEQFKVSRITVKNALAELIEDGLVFRIQGKGSFVSPTPAGEPPVYKPDAKNQDYPMIAFLMPRLDSKHNANLMNGIESELSANGYNLLFYRTQDSQEKESNLLQHAVKLGVKGIIIFPVDGSSYNEQILQLTMNQFPLVVVDRYFRGIDTNCVISDNEKGAYEATRHLIELGHRNIGFLSTRTGGTTSIEDRLIGYEKALADHGIPIDRRLRLDHFDTEQMNAIIKTGVGDTGIKQEIQEQLRANPEMTAIFAVNSAVGTTAIEAALEIGIRVPEQLSVVLFDNEVYPLSLIPATCVSQQSRSLGQESVKLLLSVMDNPRQERKKIILQPNLIVRKSTAQCPVPDVLKA